ncbi:MAG TPA: hypothetical protein VM431_13820 [Phycisphaerae bacterium]|nr:hypothetical protein [Phycisphaerae bacterium]
MRNLARGVAVMVLTVGLAAGGLRAAVAVGPARPASGPKTAAPADGPVANRSAAELKADLVAGAAQGKLTDALLKLFRDYTAARVREQYVPKNIPEDLWQWILASKELRDAILVGLHPENERDLRTLGRLSALRAKFGPKVDEFPHLALAFAIVYGYAGDEGVREPGLYFVEKNRPPPSMEDSFDYYLKNEKKMKMSLKTTPWPLLIYVADNDLPIIERRWALGRYGAKPPGAYGQVYYDVSYDEATINDEEGGRLASKARSLSNILQYGGVCRHQAYFASRVFKSMGVPSMYDRGEGARGGHAWVAWVGRAAKTADLLFAARFDYDRYFTGTLFNPLARRDVLDRDVQLDVAAMLRSYPGYLNAVAACRMYTMLDDGPRAKATGLLDGAIRQNAYASTSWRLMAMDVAKGVIPRKVGETMYAKMITTFAQYPDLTYQVLRMILEPRLKPSEKPKDKEITDNLRLLDGAFGLYVRAERPDLAVRLRYLQGQYLEACDRREQAMKLYVMASEKFATEHFGFVPLYDRACVIMKEDGKTDLMLKYMKMVAEKVPEFQADFTRRNNLVNPTYKHVILKYAAALREAGKKAEAETWADRLQTKPKG